MPYVNWDTKNVLWDASGKPYWRETGGTKVMYIPPIVAGQYHDDPKMLAWAQSNGVTADNPSGNVPGQGFIHHRGTWNSNTGRYDTPLDWGNIASIAVGGALTGGAISALSAAPVAAGTVAPAAAAGTAGTTAAGAGTAAATTATAAHWLSPVIQQAVPVVGNVIAARMQANANRDSTAAEIEQLNKALEYQKEKDAYDRADAEERKRYSRTQFTNYSAGLEPYRAAGVSAVGRTEGALTSSRYQPQLGQTAPPPATSPTEGLVRLADSTGAVRMVPASQADQFIQQGATRV